jgi:hypothetical protein
MTRLFSYFLTVTGRSWSWRCRRWDVLPCVLSRVSSLQQMARSAPLLRPWAEGTDPAKRGLQAQLNRSSYGAGMPHGAGR